MTPEGEGKLVINDFQDCYEMCLESLDGALCLVAFMVSWCYQFKLYMLLVDALLERI